MDSLWQVNIHEGLTPEQMQFIEKLINTVESQSCGEGVVHTLR